MYALKSFNFFFVMMFQFETIFEMETKLFVNCFNVGKTINF
jgi:hypothetical protein